MAITVAYDEIAGSPTSEHWLATGGFEATRVLRCAWGQRHTLALQLRGQVGGFILSPQGYPSVSFAIVRDVSIAPEGTLNKSAAGALPNTYDYALLTVHYATSLNGAAQTVTYDDGSGVVLEESFEPSAEFLSVGVKGLNWNNPPDADGALKETELPSEVIRMMDWTITRTNAPKPDAADNAYMGTVNGKPVGSLATGQTFARETLMFLGMSMSATYDEAGNVTWSVTRKIQYRPFGWNVFPRPGYRSGQPLYSGENDVWNAYQIVDFANILGGVAVVE